MTGLYKFSWVLLHCCVLSLLLFRAHGDGSEISLSFAEAPNRTSRLNSATFSFDVWAGGKLISLGGNGAPGTGCNVNCSCLASNITCKLDDGITTDCGGKQVSYTGLQDGKHKFEVCTVASPAVGCSTYNWIVDTVPPTAYITSPSSFTNATNVSVNISFTEPCIGEDGKDGFKCSSENACNLLIHGYGQVIPSSLVTLVPTRKYNLLVNLSSVVEFGNVTLEMDNNFCTDTAGNKFIRAENSTFNIRFDRSLLASLFPAVPRKTRGNITVLATNNKEDLKVYLNFSRPVLNSSTEVLNSLNTSEGTLVPIPEETTDNRMFGFKIENVTGSAVINVSFDSKFIITSLGNRVSPVETATLEYDTERPEVELWTPSGRTRQDTFPAWIEFSKPVLGFNKSSIKISGGHLDSFEEINESTLYHLLIQADKYDVSVNVPENVTEDVFGNKNQAAAGLKVWDYSPGDSSGLILSRVTSTIVTSTFGFTCLARGVLLVSTFATSGVSFSSMSDPAANLFLSLSHIQLIALSRWLPVNLPVEYYEYAKALGWSIPYFNLPWEREHAEKEQVPLVKSQVEKNLSDIVCQIFGVKQEVVNSLKRAKTKSDSPQNQAEGIKSLRSAYNECQKPKGWKEFNKTMRCLALVGGIVILLHALLILLVKIRRPQLQRSLTEADQSDYGELTFPRFEIFCIIVSLPCICKSSTGLLREGEDRLSVMVGTLLLIVTFLILLSFFIFLLVGVTHEMLFVYVEEFDEKGQENQNWYRRFGRATLGTGLNGDWKCRNQIKEIYRQILGPLFEDLRGLPSHNHGDDEIQAPGGKTHKHGSRITPSNNKKEDIEALGVNPQKNDDGIISSDDKTGNTRANAGKTYKNGDRSTPSNNEKEDMEALGVSPLKNDDGIISSDDKIGNTRAHTGITNKNGDRSTPSNKEEEDLEALRVSPQKNDNGIISSDDKTGNTRANADKTYKNGDRSTPSNNEKDDIEAFGVSPQQDDDGIISSDDKIGNARAHAGITYKNGDRSTPSNNEEEDVEALGVSPQKNDDGIMSSDDKTGNTRAHGENSLQNGDRTIAPISKTEDARGPWGIPCNKYGEFKQQLFAILRTYYILLESVRQVILGILGGAYPHDASSTPPVIILLSITCFLLFLLVLLRPFVSRRGLVVEIFCIVCEVVVFTLTLIPKKGFSQEKISKIDKCMVLLPFIGYAAGMSNQFYSLYEQIKDLDKDNKSFLKGLRRASHRFLDFFLLTQMQKGTLFNGSAAHRNGSPATTDKSGLKEPGEPTASLSSSSKQGNGGPNHPSTTSRNPSERDSTN